MALSPTEEAQTRDLIAQQAALLSLAGVEPTILSKLGATKVTLSDLPTASAINDADLLLLRQGVTDKSVTGLTFKGLIPTIAVASETVKGIVELATSAEVIAGTDTVRAVTSAGLQSKVASETVKGIVELATSAEVIAGTDTVRAVTPAALASVTATDTRAGLIELATAAETQTGTDAAKAVTPAGLTSRTATETRAGLVELATQAETQTGTDAVRAVTPATLASVTATETRAGLVELATSIEAQAFTANKFIDGAKLAAALQGSNQTLSTNGYQKLPGGLIIQWYRVSMASGSSAQTFNHPIAFPNAAFVATNTQSLAASSTGAAMMSSLTTTQITLANNSGATAANTTYIIAIGY